MTSQITRENIKDMLYEVSGPYKAHLIPKMMLAIDRYATVVAHRTVANLTVMQEPVHPGDMLAPGQTDEESDLRCCPECGKVRILSRDFVQDRRCPHGRKMICVHCRPRSVSARTGQYMCKKCQSRKELSHFPERKQADPRLIIACTACGGN